MKSNFIFFFFISIMMNCLTSCVKDAEVKLPTVEPKLVISSLIYPQSALTIVSVSMSKPIYNNSDNSGFVPLKNATVVISTGSTAWTLAYDSAHSAYIIDSLQLKIIPGASYKLSVSTPDGNYAEASTSVPYQNRSLTYTTAYSSLSGNYTLRGSWQDPPHSTDYYRLDLVWEGLASNNYINNEEATNVSDEDNPGGILTKNLEFYHNSSSTDTVYASLLTASSDFYNYFIRTKRAFDINGIFTEPTPVYTNISGGLGIFAGFNQYKVKIDF